MTEDPEERPTIATDLPPEDGADEAADTTTPSGPTTSDDSPDSRGQENVEDRANVSTVDPDDYPEQQ